MAAPLSGIATQQQTPLAQALQPAASDQSRAIRQPEQVPREDETQPREAAAAQSEEPQLSARDFREAIAESSNRSESSPRRGSVVDVTI